MGKGTNVSYPQQPSYGESLRESLQAQIDLAPQLYQAEAEARPRYAQLETDILRDTLLGRMGEGGVREQGMLDFMGAPAQRFATGDVQYQPPWVDPAEAQFQQGFQQQPTYGQQPPPQQAQQAQPYQAPWQQQAGMDRQRRGPMAEGLVQQQMDAQRAAIDPQYDRLMAAREQPEEFEWDEGFGDLASGTQRTLANARREGRQLSEREIAEMQNRETQKTYGAKFKAGGRQPVAKAWQLENARKAKESLAGFINQPAAAQPAGIEGGAGFGAGAEAIGEGQDRRIRRPGRWEGQQDFESLTGAYREAVGDKFELPAGILPGDRAARAYAKYGFVPGSPQDPTRDETGVSGRAAMDAATQKAIARATGQPVPGEAPPMTWEDVDAGQPAVGWEDVGGGGQVSPIETITGDEPLPPAELAQPPAMQPPAMQPPAELAQPPAVRGGDPYGGSRMLEQERRPGYTGEGTFGGLAQYGADIAEYGATRQRAADIRDVGLYGREATRALRQADPLSSMMLEKMAGIAGEELGGAGSERYGDILTKMRTQAAAEIDPGEEGYGGLLGEMGRQAQTGLEAQGELTARERRNAIQDARQAAEARGRVYDPLAMVGELESLEGARRERRAERRGFAGQTMAAQEARKASSRQYAANLMQMEAARRGEARGFAGGVMGQSRAMSADPFMAILGRPSGMGQQISQGAFGGAQYGLSAGPGVAFGPESGLSYMLGQQGQQAGYAAAQAGKRGQMGAGLLGMFGQLGAAKIAACWVAREVYGESNPKWKQFREWMLNKAPDWFREWYLANGEATAEWLKDKPEIKARIKIFMDSKLET